MLAALLIGFLKSRKKSKAAATQELVHLDVVEAQAAAMTDIPGGTTPVALGGVGPMGALEGVGSPEPAGDAPQRRKDDVAALVERQPDEVAEPAARLARGPPEPTTMTLVPAEPDLRQPVRRPEGRGAAHAPRPRQGRPVLAQMREAEIEEPGRRVRAAALGRPRRRRRRAEGVPGSPWAPAAPGPVAASPSRTTCCRPASVTTGPTRCSTGSRWPRRPTRSRSSPTPSRARW
ncbi:hypothetical protein GCM10025868_41470 [Angustibacter aerolatus]|uniref:Uncharacterized protein n=1 Tax=Angustibacter aerolatus TaxID=1162965 RepID=A0ABQ6JM83_9ACTN|nr:hypothetical protein [Angustibacter aerolatus]GMA88897.1 hypothetical protein GCM10025868_41470 [Angustibacter aerolatus]